MGRFTSKNTWILTGIMMFSLILSGCAAVHTSIAKKDLDVQTKMSDSIFLDPIEPSQRVIYLNIRNTSDKTNFDITPTVARALEGRGYRITTNPKEAHYWLQANILSVDKASPTAAEAALRAGYGGMGSAALGVGQWGQPLAVQWMDGQVRGLVDWPAQLRLASSVQSRMLR